jgi:hypothetical protein
MARPSTEPQFELKIKIAHGLRGVLERMTLSRMFGASMTDVVRHVLIEGVKRELGAASLPEVFKIANALPLNAEGSARNSSSEAQGEDLETS